MHSQKLMTRDRRRMVQSDVRVPKAPHFVSPCMVLQQVGHGLGKRAGRVRHRNAIKGAR